MSHPVVAQVVAHLGGWRMICSGEANFAGGLRKQVESSHERLSQKWETEVMAQLSLPPSERDPVLFGHYTPYAIPRGYQPDVDRLPQLTGAQEIEIHPDLQGRLLEMVKLPEMGRK